MSTTSYQQNRDKLLLKHRYGQCKNFGNNDCPWCLLEKYLHQQLIKIDGDFAKAFELSVEQHDSN